MEFNEGFNTTEWEINTDTIELAKFLTELKIGLQAKDIILYSIDTDTLKNKSLPIAWITINWMLNMVDSENTLIFKYHASDKYKINPTNPSKEDYLSIVSTSYNKFKAEFDKRKDFVRIQESIPEISEELKEKVSLSILNRLKEKGY